MLAVAVVVGAIFYCLVLVHSVAVDHSYLWRLPLGYGLYFGSTAALRVARQRFLFGEGLERVLGTVPSAVAISIIITDMSLEKFVKTFLVVEAVLLVLTVMGWLVTRDKTEASQG